MKMYIQKMDTNEGHSGERTALLKNGEMFLLNNLRSALTKKRACRSITVHHFPFLYFY